MYRKRGGDISINSRRGDTLANAAHALRATIAEMSDLEMLAFGSHARAARPQAGVPPQAMEVEPVAGDEEGVQRYQPQAVTAVAKSRLPLGISQSVLDCGEDADYGGDTPPDQEFPEETASVPAAPTFAAGVFPPIDEDQLRAPLPSPSPKWGPLAAAHSKAARLEGFLSSVPKAVPVVWLPPHSKAPPQKAKPQERPATGGMPAPGGSRRGKRPLDQRAIHASTSPATGGPRRRAPSPRGSVAEWLGQSAGSQEAGPAAGPQPPKAPPTAAQKARAAPPWGRGREEEEDEESDHGYTAAGQVALFYNRLGQMVNARGERVDSLGRPTRARGCKGAGSKKWWR